MSDDCDQSDESYVAKVSDHEAADAHGMPVAIARLPASASRVEVFEGGGILIGA
jgi:hypothetical protein